MWSKFIALCAAPALALVPSPVHAQAVGGAGEKGLLKAKQGFGGKEPNKTRVKIATATAQVIRSASVRLGKLKPKVRTKRRFQVNLMPNGRKLIEFE